MLDKGAAELNSVHQAFERLSLNKFKYFIKLTAKYKFPGICSFVGSADVIVQHRTVIFSCFLNRYNSELVGFKSDKFEETFKIMRGGGGWRGLEHRVKTLLTLSDCCVAPKLQNIATYIRGTFNSGDGFKFDKTNVQL